MARRNASSERGASSHVGAVPSQVQHPAVLAYNQDPIRLSPAVELAIVGGLGVFIVVAPDVAEFLKRKFQLLKARIVILKDRIRQADITKRVKILNRRRRAGSLVRVLASLLPSSMFTPPSRIYIPNWAQFERQHWVYQQDNRLLLDDLQKRDLPSENDVGDGLIEAFEVDSEVLSSVSECDEDDDSESASSTPEGWTQEQRRLTAKFNPTLNASNSDSSFARCSTPKGNKHDSHLSIQGRRPNDDQTEISELKKMVEGLMLQINCLNQSIMTNRNLTAVVNQSTVVDQVTLSSQPPEMQITVPVPPPLPVISTVVGPPPPPPPPPPPMPPMHAVGNKPLVIIKKGNQDKLIQKTTQVSLSDVLKELPNAKLRRVERSPGGTPIKPQLKLPRDNSCLDVRDQLAFALKKRFESMHSPACDTDTDKENANGSDDSFEDSPMSSIPVPAKRTLFPPTITTTRSPRRRSSNGNKQSENRLPFGQHLLKKRLPLESNGVESNPVSPLTGSPLREHN